MFDSGLVAPDLEWIPAPNTPGLQSIYRGRDFVEFMRIWTEDFEWSMRNFLDSDEALEAAGLQE